MRIGGFQKLTLVDFPGLVAATVFTQGCNFRCGFCHNPELVLPQMCQAFLPAEAVLNFLNDRRGKLQGVVITGGEPTLQRGLLDFIVAVKEMGFAVKLDTNGSHPEVLSSLLEVNLINFVAMDIKTSWAKYAQVTGIECDITKIQESIQIIINSGVPYQLRTTLVKEFCSNDDLSDIQRSIGKADSYVLQPFVISSKMIDTRFSSQSQYTHSEIELLKTKYDRRWALEIT